MMARIGTLIVIALFLGYIYAANIYLQMTYGNRAGPAVPIQQTIKAVTSYIQVAVIIAIAVMVAVMAIKMAMSKRILGIIPFKDIQKHLLLLGPTGAGKTTIAKTVIRMAVKKNIKVTILDWKAGAPGV